MAGKPTFINSQWKACFYSPFEPSWQECRIPESESSRTAWVQVQALVYSCPDLGQVTRLLQASLSVKCLCSCYICHRIGLGMRRANTGLVLRWPVSPYILVKTEGGYREQKRSWGVPASSNFRPELSVFCLVPYLFLFPLGYWDTRYVSIF